jgi:replicative DNA helicase
MSTQALARAKTGIVGLDEILHGGLIPARLYLVDGNPGAGKTTLALQFLQEGSAAFTSRCQKPRRNSRPAPILTSGRWRESRLSS